MMDDLADVIADELSGLGGILRCEQCRRELPLGDVGANLREGWPKCHGKTMRWWTARQLASGEHTEEARQ
jgi:hypothetical protein